MLVLVTLTICVQLVLSGAMPEALMRGLGDFPRHNYSIEGDNRYIGMMPADGMAYSSPARIRIKLTRITQNIDDDRLSAPQVSYFGALGVGTPAKIFNVVFDTGSNEIWLPYWNWFPFANNLHYSNGYDCKDSSTCVQRDKYFRADYRGTTLSGTVYEDLFTVYEGLTKDEATLLPSAQLSFGQNFLAITDANNEQFRYKPYDGVIGLSPVAHSNIGTRNVLLSIQSMHSRHQASSNGYNISGGEPNIYTPNIGQSVYPSESSYYDNHGNSYHQQSGFTNQNADLVFSFWFNPNLNARDGGELMLGGVDENRVMSDIVWHKINSWFDWQLPMQNVQLGGRLVSCTHGCNAIFDTGANSLIGPREDIEQIYGELQAHHDADADLWLVDCNQIDNYPVFVFRFGSNSYMIYPTHYIKMFRFRDRLVCYLAVKPRDSQDWVLGTTFIGAYYTVFNFSRRLIGLATPRY